MPHHRRLAATGVSSTAILIALGLYSSPALGACSTNTPTIGQTVTCDTSAPNPDGQGVKGWGVDDVTVNLLSDAVISKNGTEPDFIDRHGIALGANATITTAINTGINVNGSTTGLSAIILTGNGGNITINGGISSGSDNGHAINLNGPNAVGATNVIHIGETGYVVAYNDGGNGIRNGIAPGLMLTTDVDGIFRSLIRTYGNDADAVYLGFESSADISGDIITGGDNSAGIRGDFDTTVTLRSGAAITTSGIGSDGINVGSGSIVIEDGATITLSDDTSYGIYADPGSMDTVSVMIDGEIDAASGAGTALFVAQNGDVDIGTTARIFSEIFVRDDSTLDIIDGAQVGVVRLNSGNTVVHEGAGTQIRGGSANTVTLATNGILSIGAADVAGIDLAENSDVTTNGQISKAGTGVHTNGNSSVALGSTGRITVVETTGNPAVGISVEELTGQTAGSSIQVDGVITATGTQAHGIEFVQAFDNAPTVARTITVNGTVNANGSSAAGLLVSMPSAGAGQTPADVQINVTGTLAATGANSSAIAFSTARVFDASLTPHFTIDIADGAVVSSSDGPAMINRELTSFPSFGIDTDISIAGEVTTGVTNGLAIDFAYGTDNLTLLPTAQITGGINLGAGTDALILDGAAATNGQFDFDASPVQNIETFSKEGLGTWTVSGSDTAGLLSGLTGPIAVNSGTLLIDNDLSGTSFAIAAGAALGGTGAVGDIVLPASGATLTPGGETAGTFTLNALALNANSHLAFNLGMANTVGGDNDLIVVNGALTLDGVLDITAASAFGNGLYTLIQYGSLSADNGLVTGSVRSGYTYDITAAGGAVTVLVSGGSGGNNQFWDGANTTPGSIANGRGDSGDWNGSTTNWTDQTGSANAAWGDEFAIFAGTAGTVSVIGSRTFTGMQFLTDGYNIFDGDLGARLNAVSTGATINVASGVTATIGSTFIGGAITKTGAGTLEVGGRIVDDIGAVETWTVNQGELRIDGGFRAGSWSDNKALVLNNGATLTVTQFGSIDVNSVTGFTAAEINGEGHVVIGEGGFDSGRILGTASNSTVQIAGSMNLSSAYSGGTLAAIPLTGSGNVVEITSTGELVVDATRTRAIHLTGDSNRVTMDGRIETFTGTGIRMDGNSNEVSVAGSILTTDSSFSSNDDPRGILVNGNDNVITVGATGQVTTLEIFATGIYVEGDDNSVTVAGTVSTEGDDSPTRPDRYAPNAIFMSGSGNTVEISGTAQSSGTGVPTVKLLGGANITLSGTIAAASASETAILFGDGGVSLPENTLELQPGYSITGLVIGDTNAFRNNLVFGGSSGSDSFDVSAIDDAGQFRNFGPFDSAFFKSGDSVWTLTGTNDTVFPSIFRLQGGTLLIDGSMAGTGLSNLANVATLGGSGTVGYIEMHDGGTIAPGGVTSGMEIGTLTTGSLSLSSGAVLDFDLGTPNVAGGGVNDLIVVNGDLTLDGTLDITEMPGFGNGLYTLIQYGTLTADNGLEVGTAPSDYTYTIDAGTGTASAVTLTVAGGPAGNVQFWDGPNTTPGMVTNGRGGTGTWDNVTTNWTNQSGAANDVWGGEFAVFAGTAGTVAVSGSIDVTGMQFLTSDYEIAGSGELVAVLDATNIRIGSGMATISAPITGTGGIAKQEAGTLVLAGANTYSGTTLVNGGTLRAGATDTFSADSAHVVAAGAMLDLDGYDQTIGSLAGADTVGLGSATLTTGGNDTSTTFSGTIGGTGSLTKTGAGTLTLTGANSYTGLTTIDQGTLSLGSGGTGGSVVGNIFNDNNFLVFNRSDDVTYAGILSGTGSTSFIGSGTTTLTGDSSGLAGPAFVTAGNLRIGAGGSFGTSQLTVDTGGALSGLGTIFGDVSATGGTIAPGGSTVGALTINGNVTFDASSTFAVRIAADGSNDALAATTTNLAGDVSVTALDPHASYIDGQTYTILTTTDLNGVSGTFASAMMVNQSAFLTPTLAYETDSVSLTIAVTEDFSVVTETYNQYQAAMALNGLEQTGDALTVFNTIAGLNPEQAREAFDLASGEVHASIRHVIDRTFAQFSSNLRHRGTAADSGPIGDQAFTAPLAYASTAPSAGIAAIEAATGYADRRIAQAWFAPQGGRGSIDADGNADELDWWTAGLAAGYEGPVDVAVGEAWAGFGAGYVRSHSTVDARLSSADTDNFQVGIYGGWRNGPWSLAGSLAYQASMISTERRVIVGGIDRTAEADYWAHSIGFSGETAYAIGIATNTTLSPVATIDAGLAGHGGFSETGAGALNLNADAESWARFDTGIGLSLAHHLTTSNGSVTLEGRALWEHAFADVAPSQSLAFTGSPTGFEVHAPDAGRDRLRLGAGLSWDVSRDISVRVAYDGLFSGRQIGQSGSLGLDVRF